MTVVTALYSGRVLSRGSTIRWSLLAFITLVDLVWAAQAGFRIGSGYTLTFGAVLLLVCISIFYWHTNRERRIKEFAHFGAQILALYVLLMMLSYLAVSTDAPLADRSFDAIDKSMGLDWVAWTIWVEAHPAINGIFGIVYNTLLFQSTICYIYNIHTRQFWRNNEIWWITFITGTITILGSAVLPATNPYVYYGLANADHFIHMQHFLGLRDGTMRLIDFANAQGLIQLPSFHTVLAIMFTYNLRRNRWFFLAASILNAILILSCPTEGSHYFVDLLAGAIVAIIGIWATRKIVVPNDL